MIFGPWSPNLTLEERAARFREFRALCFARLGRTHPLTEALQHADNDPSRALKALAEVNMLPALARRRLLAEYLSILSPTDDRPEPDLPRYILRHRL